MIAASFGQRPSFLHWGSILPAASAEELACLSTRQWAFGGPNAVIAPSISNEFGLGITEPSGFVAHREGVDWACIFIVTRVEWHTDYDVSLHCQDANVGIGVVYRFCLGPTHDGLKINTTFKNLREDDLLIDWATVAALPVDGRFTRTWGFTGRWAREFEVEEIQAHRGSYLRENKAGRTSHDNFPGLITLAPFTHEKAGPCAGFHLAWSGNNRVRLDRHSDGQAFVQMGELLFPGELRLKANETYQTPSLYAVWSDTGLSTLSQTFHTILQDDVLDDRTADRPRPVHYNTWEAVYFDHNEERLMTLAERAAEVGAERFVLDDGWFGGRRNDRTGLGDWTVSGAVYPNGLGKIVEYVGQVR